MRAFTEFYDAIDATTATSEKLAAMAAYFKSASPSDAAIAAYFLSGQRVLRTVPTKLLYEMTLEITGLPGWLVDASYASVGDFSETIALLLPDPGRGSDASLTEIYESSIVPLATSDDAARRAIILDAWREMDARQRYVYQKLIRGGLRVGVQKKMVVRAIAMAHDLEPAIVAARMSGRMDPTAQWYESVTSEDAGEDIARPLPFYLAHQLDDKPKDTLGDRSAWLAEWKYDGIRAQLIVPHDGPPMLWSRGEEDVGEQFPEILVAARHLPGGTVLDGEVLGWEGDRPAPFAFLQTRLNRKAKTAGQLPMFDERRIVLRAFDVLRFDGHDVRGSTLRERRNILAYLDLPAPTIDSTVSVDEPTWEDLASLREQSRERRVEGLMLKHLDGVYGIGRTKPEGGTGWWKWKIGPMTLDAVLVMAQHGSGRRAGLYTDYTFALWHEGELVNFAKAYSGLTNEEIERVDNWIRRNTVRRAGPVREVKPVQVFELGFEGVQVSTRHKSGLAVRFPRILKWREDKKAEEADQLQALRRLAESQE
ncbi:MAG: ATP-dependent DNA ligase [Phycisphaerales bacterium]|jgi:DNA ligase-1